MRITMDDLRWQLKVLNDLTREDEFPYQFYMAYGAYGLDKVVNDGGGARRIIALTTKKDLYYQMESLINGIRIGKGE
jgi:hypothetical protein